MRKLFPSPLFYLSVFLLIGVVFLSFKLVVAFNPPSGNPPTGGGAIGASAAAQQNTIFVDYDAVIGKKVGIGTTQPLETLDVAGSLEVFSYGSFSDGLVSISSEGLKMDAAYFEPDKAHVPGPLYISTPQGVISVSGTGTNYFAGKIGIGTDVASYPLVVKGNPGAIQVQGASGQEKAIYIDGYLSTTSHSIKSASNALSIQANEGSNYLLLNSIAGNVGIGAVSDPGEKLEISGNLKFSSAANKIYWGSTSGVFFNEGWGVQYTGDSTHPLQVLSSSLLLGYDQTDSTDRGTGNLFVSGNVGIGTTNSGVYKVNIVGDVNITGTLTGGNLIQLWTEKTPTEGKKGIYPTTAANRVWIGYDPTSADDTSLSVKNNSAASAVYTEQSGAGYALYVKGKSYFEGNVGIGTDPTNAKLQIKDSLGGVDFLLEGNTYSNIRLKDSSAAANKKTFGVLNALNDLMIGRINDLEAMTPYLILKDGGRVAVGGDPGASTAKLVIVPGAGASIDAGNKNIINVGVPVSDDDSATKGYVDSAIGAGTVSDAESCIAGDSNCQVKNITMALSNPVGTYVFNVNGGDIQAVNRLTVSTIDPLYSIYGGKYSTYVPSITGVKEETAATIKLTYNLQLKTYNHTIDFNNLEKGSDLWLFRQITDFGPPAGGWENLTVLLTPSFDGSVWYEKDPAKKQLIIYGDPQPSTLNPQILEVSYRLTAPRFDHKDWSNIYTGSAEGLFVR